MTDYLDMETRPGPVPVRDTGAQPIPCLTILHHPELPRAGERCLLPELMGAGQVALSRAEPLFAESASERGRPLMSSYVSRKPVQLFSSASTIGVGAAATSTAVRVDGESVSGVVEVARTRLGEGVVITLAGSIVMLLHNALRAPLGDAPDFGLVGRSDAMVRVRVDIARAARSDRPGPDSRRNRDRQGAGGQGRPRRRLAGKWTVAGHQSRSRAGLAGCLYSVRTHARCVQRSDRSEIRTLRKSARGIPLPGRGGGSTGGGPGRLAPGVGDRRDSESRSRPKPKGRRAPRRRDRRRLGTASRGRGLPSATALPPREPPHRAAAPP